MINEKRISKIWLWPWMLALGMQMQLVSVAFAGQAREGGGLIVRDGEYLTFGSAKIKLKRSSKVNVEGMNTLTDALYKMPLGEDHRATLIQSVLPSQVRRYYDVDEIRAEEAAELKKIYQKTLGLDSTDDLALAAVTNVATRETFLLPDFYKIKSENGRAAILFHEGAWLIARGYLGYRDIIELEIAFENYLDKGLFGFDPDLYTQLGILFRSNQFYILEAIQDDYRSGRFKAHLQSDGSLAPEFLFGTYFLKINLFKSGENLRDRQNYGLKMLQAHALKQSRLYPEIETFKAILTRKDRVLLMLQDMQLERRGINPIFAGPGDENSFDQLNLECPYDSGRRPSKLWGFIDILGVGPYPWPNPRGGVEEKSRYVFIDNPSPMDCRLENLKPWSLSKDTDSPQVVMNYTCSANQVEFLRSVMSCRNSSFASAKGLLSDQVRVKNILNFPIFIYLN